MPITGDFGKMLDWIGLLKNGHILVEMQSAALAECMITLIADGFERGYDPYGRKWAPKKKPDGRKVLHGETSRLRTGWHVESGGRRGFRVVPSVPYAAYHQAPRFNRRPTRMQVPTMALGLPRRWASDMREVALAVAYAHFTGGRVPRGARGVLNAAKRRIKAV